MKDRLQSHLERDVSCESMMDSIAASVHTLRETHTWVMLKDNNINTTTLQARTRTRTHLKQCFGQWF
jgi:hypothetical protein